MLRREFLTSLVALAAGPALATTDTVHSADTNTAPFAGLPLGKPQSFSPSDVIDMARVRAQSAYKARRSIPQEWLNIDYDEYRAIWFDTKHALWADEPQTPVRIDVFAPGLYFPHPIAINIVEAGQTRSMGFNLEAFAKTDMFPDLPIDDSLGYSGLRLRAELEQPSIFQEFAVFQGASYFRAIGTKDIYGLSARGLAIDVAEPTGEEFPDFVAFWIEKPSENDKHHVVHALLDSPSCTGAYRFDIRPGQPLTMDVEATVFPREDMAHVGIAPLTSMFQFDETNRDRFSDFRPAVHDSDGLLIHTGADETLWRPLANPRSLQISAFGDDSPKGFGLMQRARKFSDFADLEAHYHRRPCLWVEPHEGWGKGAVTLVEIPTDREIYDNIVSYWRPAEAWMQGSEHKLSYRLTWGDDSTHGHGLKVINTRMGNAFETGIIVTVDFEASADIPQDLSQIDSIISSSEGTVSAGVLQNNPETGGVRLAFKFEPGEATSIEFNAQLRIDGKPLSEKWLYRWTV
jgi:glucans biosynthesis protein